MNALIIAFILATYSFAVKVSVRLLLPPKLLILLQPEVVTGSLILKPILKPCMPVRDPDRDHWRFFDSTRTMGK